MPHGHPPPPLGAQRKVPDTITSCETSSVAKVSPSGDARGMALLSPVDIPKYRPLIGNRQAEVNPTLIRPCLSGRWTLARPRHPANSPEGPTNALSASHILS